MGGIVASGVTVVSSLCDLFLIGVITLFKLLPLDFCKYLYALPTPGLLVGSTKKTLRKEYPDWLVLSIFLGVAN